MSSDMMITTDDRPALSGKNRVGLALAGLLGLLEVVTSQTAGPPGAGEVGPPQEVLMLDLVLGAVTIVAVLWTWRSRSRVGSRLVAFSRILAMITALPAFFVPGVPAPLVALVGVNVVVTVVVVGLVLSRPPTRLTGR